MAINDIDFMVMVDNAFYCLKTQTGEQYENQAARLLSDAHYELDRWGDKMEYKTGLSNKDVMFKFLKNVMMFFICFDGQLRTGEYNIYSKWCRKVGYTPVSADQLKSYAARYTFNDYIKNVDLLAGIRGELNDTHYHSMVYGLVMLSVYGSGRFTREAYEVLKRFLKPGYDNCPSYEELMSQIY